MMRHLTLELGSMALKMALTSCREEEQRLKKELKKQGVLTCAVDCGGYFLDNITKIIEHVLGASQRQNIISDKHIEVGSLVGATQEALEYIKLKLMGLNVGGKIGVARMDEHIVVAIYLGFGLVYLNDIAVSIGHRVITKKEPYVSIV